ncbi:Retrovirus-related Pol polyprotein from transposon RE2 [Vitis vinifera]|uniref:Retrovirus-related Pol polyprotein from transposon RE2 n=1 Tax=Vitis vinifera TaxID=29760 RepID=A0A438DRH3_VITVI|nr:Retrovirus-related Pol polyprotein from transposon RE2 [Vitis vinifera]
MGQGYEDHLVTQEADIPEVDRVQWRKINAQLCSVLCQSVDPKILLHLRAYKTCFKFWNQVKGLYTNDIQRLYKMASSIVNIDKFFMVLTLISLRPDLETVRDQILGSSSVPSLDDVFARLLRISSTQTLSSDNTSDSSVLVSQTNSRGGRSVTWQPPRTAHMAQSSDPQPPQPPSSSTSQGISLTDSEYDDYLRYQVTKSTSVPSVAQTGNASACLTHTSSFGPWILDSSASDLISGNKDLFSSITTTSALPIVTLANGFQTVAKGIGLAHPLPSLPLTSDRSTGKTIGIGRESQGLYHLTSPSTPAVCISIDAPLLIHSCLGHPSLSKFQKMVPRFSSLSSLALTMPGNVFLHHLLHLYPNMGSFISLLVLILLNKMGYLNDKLSARATKCIFLGYSRLQKGYRCYSSETHRYFLSANVTFFEDSPFFSTSESLPVSEVLPLPIISPLDVMPSRPLQVYHRRHRVTVPPSLAEVPADSLPIPSASPAPALPPSADLPIALRKDNRFTRNPHPIYNFLSYHRLFSPYFAFVSTISSVSLPKSTPEALSYPGWRQAMVDEMAALHSNGTWDLVVLPSGKSTVGCRWVYTVKIGPDGQVDRLKVRLVAKGYTQVYGSDYGVTFSPVAKIASVRLLLSMAAMRSWPLYQLDIKNAFLHGDLAEEVYMEQPPDFVAQGESSLVCRLRHSLYGLKQSPRAWDGDSSIQFRCGSFPKEVCLDILEETNMLDCKPVDTPMDPNVKLIPRQGEPLGDPGRYRRLVGKLNYLTITHPDISFPVSVVSQFLQSPCDSHWDVVIRILRYIKSTPGQGVLYENKGHTQVIGYTDADWAGSPTDRRFTSEYCVFIGGNLISWKSKKQDVVARSSAKAEYRAMALATCELIWLKHLLREL